MLIQKHVSRIPSFGRELFLFILVCLLTLGPLFQNIAATTTVSAAQDIRVFIDDRLIQLEAKPIIQNGRTLVPMRGIFEALGAAVTWNANTRTALGLRGNIEVRIPLGSRNPTVNGRRVTIEVAAQTIGGRTYIPLRFVGEALGDTVRWDGATSRINITRQQHVGGTTPPAQPTTPPARPTTHPTVITYWAATSPETRADDPERLEAFLEVERKLNVDIQWIHIPPGTESEQFTLMVAADNLADVVFYNWSTSTPRPEQALADNIIIPLNNIINNHAPNLRRYMQNNPETARDMRTDTGQYYVFPYLRGQDMSDRVINGLYLRRDWLNELGLRAPETISDWTNVLRAFRDRKGADVPLGLRMGNIVYFALAYGLNVLNFVPVGDRIIMGAIQPELRPFLQTMRDWIAEGLLHIDISGLSDLIVRGEVGAWVTTPGQHVNEGRVINPRFDIIPVSNPVLRRGDTPFFLPRWPFTGRGAAISAKADPGKHEAIARWLDYSYSEDAYIRDTFGVEGVHFNWLDGKIMPIMARILNPPNRLTTSQYLRRNFRHENAPGPYLTGDEDRLLHPNAPRRDPNHRFKTEAVAAWSRGSAARTLPTLSFTLEEIRQKESFENMWPYITQMMRDFMFDRASLNQFDDYVRESKRLGATEWLRIFQASFDRYRRR